MDLSKLEVGMEFKNYKELCEVLGENVKAGNAKVGQMLVWESYFKMEKEKHRIRILSIYDKPKGTASKHGFITEIESLILDLLVQDQRGQVLLSKVQLFKMLNMINDNYGYSRYNIPKLSVFIDISEAEIHEFYNLSRASMISSIESALNRLKNKSLVYWQYSLTLCRIDVNAKTNRSGLKSARRVIGKNEYEEDVFDYYSENRVNRKFTEATPDEVAFILKTEREQLFELECTSKQEVVSRGLWSKYVKQVNDILFEEMNVIFYYDSYKIISNKEHILEVWSDLKELQIKEEEKKKSLININETTKNKLFNNAKVRKKKHEQDNVTKNEWRSSSTYVENNRKLINCLIDMNHPCIKNNLKNLGTKRKNER